MGTTLPFSLPPSTLVCLALLSRYGLYPCYPLLQSSDRLEFSKNNLTENQWNEQREHKQLNSRLLTQHRYLILKQPKSRHQWASQVWLLLPTPCPCQERPTQEKLLTLSSMPQAGRSGSEKGRWYAEHSKQLACLSQGQSVGEPSSH
jgi:hypothetical protein